jgi:aryl-alcohol dehydrogenase-like predicted oxidoreductase
VKYIEVGKQPKKVSQLVMGTDYFHSQNLDTVHDIMTQFMNIGGNTFDTANIYRGGESELALGQWMEETKTRDQLVIFTKGAHHDQKGPRVNREAIYQDVMTSIERLRVPYIDLYGLHRDDPQMPVGVILEALNEHIEAGRIGAIGGSNWTHQRLHEANTYAEQHGLIGFSFSSPNLSLAKAQAAYWPGCVSADEATLKWHTKSQLPLFSWSSQARGFFTERAHPQYLDDANLVRVFYNEANWQRRARAEQLAKNKGVKCIEIALAYVLNQPFPTCALIGPRGETEMKSCQNGTSIHLTAEEMAWLVDGKL